MTPTVTELDDQNRLIQQLLSHPHCFGHATHHVEHIETHISHLLLIGDYAYKIKKPLNLGFLDFSTLEKRHQCCTEELRLNKRAASNLYLEVVAIGGSIDNPQLAVTEKPLEYAVKMRRFHQQELLDRYPLKREMIDRLAQLIADFHQQADVTRDPVFGMTEHVVQPMQANFRTIRALRQPLLEVERLNSLQTWTEQQARLLEPIFEERYLAAKIRECHGDLHLGNITLFEGQITLFDGIEFNSDLRWIDTISDLAFLLMDLQHRELNQIADQLLNRYLEKTGDYAGLRLLRFYLLYRAMVRAKVCAIRAFQPGLLQEEMQQQIEAYRSYLALAESVIRHPPASLIITHGVSGSGKSTVSGWFAEQLMAIRLRSDVERKRLFPEPQAKQRYSNRATQITYNHLSGMAKHLLRAGFSVMIDVTCLMQWQRRIFIQLAESQQAPILILDCQVSEDLLHDRIEQRNRQGKDASEADLDVLKWQQETAEPFTQEEQALVISIDTDHFPPSGFLATVLQHLMR
ncbi:MAG: AAA family ATPase [Candidatus Thiodiazotropha sp.]|jgi:uncharacterized protein